VKRLSVIFSLRATPNNTDLSTSGLRQPHTFGEVTPVRGFIKLADHQGAVMAKKRKAKAKAAKKTKRRGGTGPRKKTGGTGPRAPAKK
jgi:hypothetical protein